ncbi:MAG: AlpA family phage regulatory protein [Sedimentitalea sp.]|nr:AlpA family phage regulatory protein [Sedimentitalea sp.]
MHNPSPNDSLVRISTLVDMLQRSRASIYRDIKCRKFPKPLKQGRSSRWLLSEIIAHIEARSAERFED